MNEIKLLLFCVTLALELIYLALFILTIKLPNFRFWPPPKPRSWQFFTAWLIAYIVVMNILLLGLLDFDSFVLPSLKQRLPFTIGFVVLGSAIGTWAWSTFGLRNTIGVGYKLITRGAYRYSRNPQYIADSLGAIGYMIFTNSWMVCLVGWLGILLNLLAPYTEETWLEERYGQEYRQYKREFPRFLGCRHTNAG
jgi:protein-S-isoprenylcysteine O-methyltransferase Ste14